MSIRQIITWKHNQHHKITNVSLTTFYIVAVQTVQYHSVNIYPLSSEMVAGPTMVLCRHHLFWWGWHWIQEKLGTALFISRKTQFPKMDNACFLLLLFTGISGKCWSGKGSFSSVAVKISIILSWVKAELIWGLSGYKAWNNSMTHCLILVK